MATNRLARRRISAAVGGAAIIAMIGFTAACSTDSDKPEESQPRRRRVHSPGDGPAADRAGSERLTDCRMSSRRVRIPFGPAFLFLVNPS